MVRAQECALVKTPVALSPGSIAPPRSEPKKQKRPTQVGPGTFSCLEGGLCFFPEALLLVQFADFEKTGVKQGCDMRHSWLGPD